MRLLWLISQGIVGILGRGTERARSAHTGVCGPACLHGLKTAAFMSCLSASNAIVACLSGGRCHHEERKCEQRRGGGGEFFRNRFHPVFSCFSGSHKRFLSARSVLSFTTALIGAELGPTTGTRPQRIRRYSMTVIIYLSLAKYNPSAANQCPLVLSRLGLQILTRIYTCVRVETSL